MKKKILVINGPNLNMLGKRDKDNYGELTLNKINKLIKKTNENTFKISFFQSNFEGKIINKIQKSQKYFAIIINPGAYTHTSIAIHDALEIYKGIILEVHLSDIYNREEYRKINYITELAEKSFIGEKENSYINAINYLKNKKI